MVDGVFEPRRLQCEALALRWGYSVSGIRKLVKKRVIPATAYFKLGPASRLIFMEEEIEKLEKQGGAA